MSLAVTVAMKQCWSSVWGPRPALHCSLVVGSGRGDSVGESSLLAPPLNCLPFHLGSQGALLPWGLEAEGVSLGPTSCGA